MKVYIVIFGVNYEGEDIEGVFGTFAAAEAKVEELKPLKAYSWAEKVWDFYEGYWNHQDLYLKIEEWDVE